MAEAPPPYSTVGSDQKGPPPQQPGVVPPPAVGQTGSGGGYTVQQQHHTIIVQGHGSYGPHSQQITCPHCQAQIMTATTPVTGLLTWIVAGVLLFLGCWCGCCLIPFCTEQCQDIEHRCPNCQQYLGTHKRIN